MLVLGIETSCDDTAASVVKDGRQILSNVVSSSLRLHKKYGGIIPEIATRKHVEAISFVVEQSLCKAAIDLKDIDLISVTQAPGLMPALLIGISFARALSFSLKIPLVCVNHLLAHLYAPLFLHKDIRFPFAGLIVSGGHTSLYYFKDVEKCALLGLTKDDAAGEAFDKVAKILRLGYPGGPVIERAALKGNPKKIKFSCGKTESPLDFSFSGIKTAVLYYVQKHSAFIRRRLIQDIAASFQEAVINCLVEKSIAACRKKRVKTLLVGGGVASNSLLRERLTKTAKQDNIKVYFASKELSLDNAAMVAGLGYQLYKRGAKCFQTFI